MVKEFRNTIIYKDMLACMLPSSLSIILSENLHDSRRFTFYMVQEFTLVLLDGGPVWIFYTILNHSVKKENSSSAMLHNSYMPFGKNSQFINTMTMVNEFTMKMVHIIEDITDSKILHSCR
jgi:hypothetical protein